MQGAAIDVGSNTLRLLIADIRDNTFFRIHTDRAVTRLAGGMRDTGGLRQENMERSLSVLRDFARSAAEHGVTTMRAVGTSALREAENSRAFVDRAFQETGIGIEILSGVREAELTLKGILFGMGDTDGLLSIDIGGGSTEWMLYRGPRSHGPLLCGSLPLGVVSLFERFIKTDPPSRGDISSATREIDAQISALTSVMDSPAMPQFVGTGGTVTTLASMDLGLKAYAPEKIHMHTISRAGLSRLRDKLLALPLERRAKISGLEPARADLIIPGVLLTIRLMDFLGFSELTVSDFGLLEGLIEEMNDENSF